MRPDDSPVVVQSHAHGHPLRPGSRGLGGAEFRRPDVSRRKIKNGPLRVLVHVLVGVILFAAAVVLLVVGRAWYHILVHGVDLGP